jgi:hypothetical protein
MAMNGTNLNLHLLSSLVMLGKRKSTLAFQKMLHSCVEIRES